MNLSPRLRYISSHVPFAANIIDVGTDHSYLAIDLAKKNPRRCIIASDIAEQPLATGMQNAEKCQLTNIDFRLGDGLSVLTAKDDINIAIISGIGGILMRALLDASKFELKRYILQPNNEAAHVRAWLEEHDYQLVADERIKENSHIYEVFIAEKKTQMSSKYKYAKIKNDRIAEFYFGPNIPRTHQVNYNMWLIAKIKQLNRQIEQMAKSANAQVQEAITKYDKLITYGTMRLTNLQEGKE